MNCVKTNGDFICLETALTSYVIRVNGTYAEHVYYGAKIPARITQVSWADEPRRSETGAKTSPSSRTD